MIHILIADDHPLMRDALNACIEDESDMEVVTEVASGLDAVEAVIQTQPNVAIIDLFLPDMDGIEVIRKVLEINPAAQMLIFTSSTGDEKIEQAIQAGALGYLIKDAQRDEILLAIRMVSQGRSYLSSTVAEKLTSRLRHARAANAPRQVDPLTQREEDILALIGTGASNTDIAQDLHIGETTVRTHIYHILQKMGLKNRSQLLMYLLQQKKS